jgi:uncharacterized phiE125 gp8 family phage protein
MFLTCTAPATTLPFGMETLRLHCRIDEDDATQDDVLDVYAWAAVGQGEFETNRAWLDSEWTVTFDEFPMGNTAIVIPKSPCTEIVSVTYEDESYTETAFTDYRFTPSSLQSNGGQLFAELKPIGVWPADANVKITFRAGWPIDKFPKQLVQWILVKVSGKFEQREDLASATRKIAIPFPRHFIDSLLDAYYIPR